MEINTKLSPANGLNLEEMYKENLAKNLKGFDSNGFGNSTDVLQSGVETNVTGLPQDWQNSNDLELVNDLTKLTNNPNQVKDASSPDSFYKTFSNALGDGINNLNQIQVNSEQAIQTLASGGNIDVHSVMIASEKANLSMQLGLQLRNKAVQAYQEISKMQI